MAGEKISKRNYDSAQFHRLLRGIPYPITMFDNCVFCPWCGHQHYTVSFGENECEDCHKGFTFGVPPWGSSVGERPETYVNCPHTEFDEMGKRGDILPLFEPSDRLKDVYEQVKEFWPPSIDGADVTKVN